MIRVRVRGHEFCASAFVFDKDGLMFESQRFWQELGDERMRQMKKLGYEELTEDWAACFGLTLDEAGNTAVCDPKGILAIASPVEEVSATAALMVHFLQMPWDEAREAAAAIFAAADDAFVLKRALKPRKGFPGILRRLREAGIPYGVASSDTQRRVRESLELFDDPDAIAFCITAKDVPHGKPAPDMLFKAAELLRLPVGELVMVGDSFVDAEMARAAGCRCIGVPETEEMRARMESAGAIPANDLDEIELF